MSMSEHWERWAFTALHVVLVALSLKMLTEYMKERVKPS